MVTDPISDMLTQLKNAARAGKPAVTLPLSNFKLSIANLLMAQGFLTSVVKRGKKNHKWLHCELAFRDGRAVLSEVKRVSKPSRRIYVKATELKPVRQGKGVMVISTPQGVLVDKQAREAKVGGEVLFIAW